MADIKRIASHLWQKHPTVVERGMARIPITAGDIVSVDAIGSALPELMTGRVVEIRAKVATVAWHDGRSESVPVDLLFRVNPKYEQPLPMVMVAFRPGDRIVLGNGDHGEIIKECIGPTGFSSWQVKIVGSVSPMAVGRNVYATEGAMNFRSAGFIESGQMQKLVDDLRPDASVSFHVDGAWVHVACEIATSPQEQAIGLQKVSSMPPDRGMVFPYEPAKNVAFHMGTVLFPIDMLFVANGRVQRLVANIQPGTQGLWQQDDVAMVVEVPGGYSKRHGIHEGTMVTISATKTAQEKFQPNREDNYPARTMLPILPRDDRFVDRFLDHALPDEQMKDQAPSPAHYEQQYGYDVVTQHDSPDAPATRSSSKDDQ